METQCTFAQQTYACDSFRAVSMIALTASSLLTLATRVPRTSKAGNAGIPGLYRQQSISHAKKGPPSSVSLLCPRPENVKSIHAQHRLRLNRGRRVSPPAARRIFREPPARRSLVALRRANL